jgi:phage replication-related protein YjqB (UPF0714/DUF867 family)
VTWSELLAHPDVSERAELGTGAGIMAFHAGLESGTLEIATMAASACGASLYVLHQPPELRWHVPSAQVDPGRSPALARWLAHVDRVVAVHGYGRRDRPWDVLIGGAASGLAAEAGTILRAALPSLRIVDDPDDIPPELQGRHPGNPVNRARRGGVQVEVPIRVRRGPLAGPLALALADVVRAWERRRRT